MEKYRIKISHCNWAENPFEAWDCEPDLFYQINRHEIYDCSRGRISNFLKDKATRGFIIRHQKDLSEILGVDISWMNADDKVYELQNQIGRAEVYQLAKLCELFKIPHLNYESRGYSQGDCSNVLLVCTDEFFKRTGCKRKDVDELLKGAEKLFDAWAWGDVYQFTVEKATEMVKLTREDFDAGKFEDVEDELEWNHHNGCSGFYGEDVEGVAENSGAPIEVVKDAFYYENLGKWVDYEKI